MATEAVPDVDAEVEHENVESSKEKPEYVEIADPSARDILFLKSECPERKVIRVVCDQIGKLQFYTRYIFGKLKKVQDE